MYSSLQDLLKERENLFPKVILEGGTLKFIKTEKVLVTSEGTLFKGTHGHYEGFVMFTAKDGKQSSSFNYTSFNLPTHLSSYKPALLQTSNLAELLRQSSEQTSVKKIPAKFDGDIIITAPGKTVDFVSRFFAPNAGIDEDPVTGSAHSQLIPFWGTLALTFAKART